MAKDLLFATLDPTLRQLNLPQGTRVILSDTVGFVSNLPTHLVAAFRATLEEVIEAELILHVRDIAHEDSEAQSNDVYSVLSQLGVEEDGRKNVIEVWNKVDLLDPEALETMQEVRSDAPQQILISAVTGFGTQKLLEKVEDIIADSDSVIDVTLPVDKLGRLPWVYENAHIIERKDLETGAVSLKIRAGREVRSELKQICEA